MKFPCNILVGWLIGILFIILAVECFSPLYQTTATATATIKHKVDIKTAPKDVRVPALVNFGDVVADAAPCAVVDFVRDVDVEFLEPDVLDTVLVFFAWLTVPAAVVVVPATPVVVACVLVVFAADDVDLLELGVLDTVPFTTLEVVREVIETEVAEAEVVKAEDVTEFVFPNNGVLKNPLLITS